MILEISRSKVRAQIDGKCVTIEGEGFLPGYGSPDFVLYRNSVQKWDPPDDGEAMDDAMRLKILDTVKIEMEADKGMTVEIE